MAYSVHMVARAVHEARVQRAEAYAKAFRQAGESRMFSQPLLAGIYNTLRKQLQVIGNVKQLRSAYSDRQLS
jgi:hypothetical protein